MVGRQEKEGLGNGQAAETAADEKKEVPATGEKKPEKDKKPTHPPIDLEALRKAQPWG